MDRAGITVLLVLLVLVVAAVIFYTNPAENHRQVAIGLCELTCQNRTSSGINYSGVCIKNSTSFVFGYGCAVSSSQNVPDCGSPTVYVDSKCQLIGVQ